MFENLNPFKRKKNDAAHSIPEALSGIKVHNVDTPEGSDSQLDAAVEDVVITEDAPNNQKTKMETPRVVAQPVPPQNIDTKETTPVSISMPTLEELHAEKGTAGLAERARQVTTMGAEVKDASLSSKGNQEITGGHIPEGWKTPQETTIGTEKPIKAQAETSAPQLVEITHMKDVREGFQKTASAPEGAPLQTMVQEAEISKKAATDIIATTLRAIDAKENITTDKERDENLSKTALVADSTDISAIKDVSKEKELPRSKTNESLIKKDDVPEKIKSKDAMVGTLEKGSLRKNLAEELEEILESVEREVDAKMVLYILESMINEYSKLEQLLGGTHTKKGEVLNDVLGELVVSQAKRDALRSAIDTMEAANDNKNVQTNLAA